MDNEDRENEGDLIFAAETITSTQIALFIRECSGIVCLCMTDEKMNQLNLPPMVLDNTCKNGTAFTVTIEAKVGVITGIDAADPITTIKTAVNFARKHEMPILTIGVLVQFRLNGQQKTAWLSMIKQNLHCWFR